MSSRSTLVSEIQRLLTGEHADPRAAQGVFLVPVAVELLLRLFAPADFDVYFYYGSAMALVPTLGSVAISKGWASNRWTIWLPVLDMVALGTYRLSDSTAIGIAIAFPAIWLGLQFGRRGVVVTIVTVLTAFVLPTLITFGLTLAAFSRVTQLTLMAVICSGAVAMTAELWKAQVVQTRNSATRLEKAMTDVIEQRKLTKTIITTVDVGLVAIDANGAYDTMNPRHQDFMDLAFPAGHAGMAGQTGFVYAADGVSVMGREDMPTSRAVESDLDMEADGERLAQVFDNLFSNAIKYTPQGGQITASLTREGEHAVVRVHDTGRGISEAERGDIFTKFFRSRTVLTDAIPGVGLGLAITKTIVDAHGGAISVSSELGQGTTFEVRLPLVQPQAVPAA